MDVTRYSEGDEGIEEEGMDAHGYLRSVYQNPLEPTHVRMRAAMAAIEYERPTLKAMAVVYGGDFATRLEMTIKRTEQAKLIEHQKVGGDED